jgi:hypothetical protein
MTTDAGFRCAASEVAATDENSSLLLYDDFVNVDSGWWQAREPVNNYFYGYHPSDFYHMQVNAADSCLAISNDLTVDNFMAEIKIFTASTDTETGNYRYGFTFRQVEEGFYAFMIAPRTQSWELFKSTTSGLELVDEGISTTIRGDAVETRDTLFVVANGPEMAFFVNGELVTQIVDDTYTNGRIGFILNTLDETYTHAHFDSIAVWPLPETVVAADGVGGTAVTIATEPLCGGSVNADNLLEQFSTYTVVDGDTLSSIAAQFNITEAALVGANGKTIDNPSVIQVGQHLIIPQG